MVRGAGKFKQTPSFEKRYGLKACCIAGGGLYKGIAKILGMDILNVKGATGLADTNLKNKFSAVKSALKKYNFIFCHIKATDTFGHDGDYNGKKLFIQKIDKALLPLLNLEDTLLAVTADHCTPCTLEDHSSDPVPILIYNMPGENNIINKFSEKNCKLGKLGKFPAQDIVKKLLLYRKKNIR